MATRRQGFSVEKTSLEQQEGESFMDAFQSPSSDWNVGQRIAIRFFLILHPVVVRQNAIRFE